MYKCKQCDNEFTPKNKRYHDFCSHSCAARFNNLKRGTTRNTCKMCGKLVTHTGSQHCSVECRTENEYQNFISEWKSGKDNGVRGLGTTSHIKKYLLSKYDNKCTGCGFDKLNPSGKTILEIEHIDGDYTNNNESNLTLLCPNCHAMTPTFRAKNRGNGRAIRKTLLRPNGEVVVF